MTSITDRGWTLHYTIGTILASPVKAGDLVPMPAGQGNLIISGGRAPVRSKDTGAVFVHDPADNQSRKREVQPGALGTVWISAAGGWSELPGGKGAAKPERASTPAQGSDSRPASSMTFVELTEDAFLARFKPVPNPLSNDAGLDSDAEYVRLAA